jgi:hypothetical protein
MGYTKYNEADLRGALQTLADAAGRYLYDAGEASPEVRQEMRERLAAAEDSARTVLGMSVPSRWQSLDAPSVFPATATRPSRCPDDEVAHVDD